MRAAVVGAGQISRQHLSCLRELRGVEIAAICDLSRTVAEAAADRFRVPRWFTDAGAMLRDVQPQVVHVTTPPSSHFALTKEALHAGAHVIVEKPATLQLGETMSLLEQASNKQRVLVEDYNYLFNAQVQTLLGMIDDGAFGSVTHVEAFICLPIAAKDSPFVDPNAPHPCSSLEGGAIFDFLSHLASLAHAFVGEHRSVRTIWAKRGNHTLPSDEFRALVEAERGTAILGFSAHAQPDAFLLRVLGSKMRAEANLFEPGLTLEPLRDGPKPLTFMRNGISKAKQLHQAAFSSVWRKLSGGPGAYEGLWELVRRTYASLEAGTQPPVSPAQVLAVNRLVHDLIDKDYRL